SNEVSRLCAPVVSVALLEPASAEPHVRTGTGDVFPADAARSAGSDARLQSAGGRATDSPPPRLVPGLRAQDARSDAPVRSAQVEGGAAVSGYLSSHWLVRWWRYRRVHR